MTPPGNFVSLNPPVPDPPAADETPDGVERTLAAIAEHVRAAWELHGLLPSDIRERRNEAILDEYLNRANEYADFILSRHRSSMKQPPKRKRKRTPKAGRSV